MLQLRFHPDGDLLVSIRQTGELYLVTPEGIVSVWGSVRCSSPCRGGNDGPRNIISDSEGSLFMLMAPTSSLEGNRLERITRVALDAGVEIRPDTLNLKRLGVSDQNGHESAWHADLDHHLARSRLGFSLRKGDQGIYCTGRERGR